MTTGLPTLGSPVLLYAQKKSLAACSEAFLIYLTTIRLQEDSYVKHIVSTHKRHQDQFLHQA